MCSFVYLSEHPEIFSLISFRFYLHLFTIIYQLIVSSKYICPSFHLNASIHHYLKILSPHLLPF